MITYHGCKTIGDLVRDKDGKMSSYTCSMIFTVNACEPLSAIMEHPKIPVPGSYYEKYTYLVLNSVTATIDYNGDKTRKYTVICKYGSGEADSAANGGGSDTYVDRGIDNGKVIFNQAYNWSADTVKYVVPLENAYASAFLGETPKPLINVWKTDNVSMECDVPVVTTLDHPILQNTVKLNKVVSFNYNIASFNPLWYLNFTGKINANKFTLLGSPIKAFAAKITQLKATQEKWATTEAIDYAKRNNLAIDYLYYFKIDMAIEIQDEGWGITAVNRDLWTHAELDNGIGVIKRIHEYDGAGEYGVLNSGFGTYDDLKTAITEDTSIDAATQAERINLIRPIDTPITIDELGHISLKELDNRVTYKPCYLAFLDADVVDYKPLSIPPKILGV